MVKLTIPLVPSLKVRVLPEEREAWKATDIWLLLDAGKEALLPPIPITVPPLIYRFLPSAASMAHSQVHGQLMAL